MRNLQEILQDQQALKGLTMTKELGFKNIPIRFFIWDGAANEDEGDYMECDEEDFKDADGEIEYERHTVFENGCSQICLTKNPFGAC